MSFRKTVDLTAYPDMVVVLLGMRVRSVGGLRKLLQLGPQIQKSVDAKPDGLLLHEGFLFSLIPPHVGMRQYWRDFESMERWTRQMPHQQWWRDFLRDPGGTGFWHETYFMRGGFEAIYDNMPEPVGMARFVREIDATGPMFSARQRLRLKSDETIVSQPDEML